MVKVNNIEIGSYFSVMENTGTEYHNEAIKLNTARNAIEYILKAKNYKKIYIPYFVCDAVLEPIKKLELEYEFYNINKKLEIKTKLDVKDEEVILIVNYYGLKTKYIKKAYKEYTNVIIDNTQAFFSKFGNEVDVVYSCRKFFPVSDGSYLYTSIKLDKKFETNLVFNKLEYLAKRYELGSNSAYDAYSKNEKLLCEKEIKYMSKLTENSMRGFDYEKIKLVRERNFLYLHNFFKDINELKLEIDELVAPLAYPLMISDEKIRNLLVESKIYLARYWPEVLDRDGELKLEKKMTKYILPLPIDHRYGIKEMNVVINKIKKFRSN